MKWRKTMAALLALVMTLQSVPALAAEPEKPVEEPALEEEYLPEPEPQAQMLAAGEQTYKPYPEATYELKYKELADGTLEITGYTGTDSSELRLPESIGGKSVTSIGERAFFGCSGFTDGLTIPESVTSIGNQAFCNCGGFTGGLTIPESVTIIGESAFNRCTGFTGELTIPTNVTSIGAAAFQACTGFTGELTLPDGVTVIRSGTFYECTGLTGQLTIPDSVTTIENGAFYGCTGFTGELKIPAGVTIIKTSAFERCSGFTGDLTISADVTTIEDCVFAGCTGLTGAYFLGDAPSIYATDSRWYCSFEPDLPLYYKKGTTGWTDSPDYDAAAGTWKGYKLRLWSGFVVPEVQVPNGKYAIQVVTDQGNPIAGADVRWNGRLQTTDQEGVAFFPKLTTGEPVITVHKAGYLDWTNENSSWSKNEKCYDTVVLYSATDGAYKLAEARYSNAASMKPSLDLLTKTKKVSLGNDAPLTGSLDFATFYLQCTAMDPSQVQSYALLQDGKRIAESADGSFTLKTDQFTEGGKCVIRVTATDGTEVDTGINLVFTKDPIHEASEINISGNAIKFHVSDKVPFLGGADFKFSLPLKIPVQAAMTDEHKFMLGFNLNLTGGESDKEMLKDAKKTLTELKKLNSYDLNHMSKKDLRNLRKLVKKSNKMEFFKKGNVDFVGYGELDAGSSVANGQIALLVSVDAAKFGFNTVVVVVPVTVQVGLTVGANVVGEIKYDWKNATLIGGLNVSPYGELEAFGGVGVGRAVGVGAYGSATLEADIQLFGTDPGLQKVDLTGALGVKAYIAWAEYKKPFAHHTWHLYTANSAKALAAEDREGAQLFDASAYTPMNLDYLDQQGPWMDSEVQLFATDAKMQLQVLQEQIFRNAQPVMTAGPDGLYAAFVNTDAASKAPCVQLTKYDGSAWSQPVAVHADTVLDGSPALYFDGEILHLAYTRTTPGYDPNSLLSTAQNQQVVAGTVDPNTLVFTEEQVYEGGFLQVPQFVDCGGTPTLVWLDSTVASDNDVLFAPSGSISYAEYAAGWSVAQTLCAVDQPVLSMTPGCPGGVLGAACVLDTDGNPQTEEDRGIYSLNGSGQTLLAANCQGSVTWDTLPGAAEPAFLWNNENRLCSSLGTELPVPGLTADYQILGNRLYYSAPSQDAANLTVMAFENDRWSAPITLTGDNRYLEHLSMADWQGCDYVMGLSTFATITENDVDDAKNLVFGSVQPVSDLILDDVACSLENLAPGAVVPVTLAIVNGGDHAISSVDLFVDGVKQGTEVCKLLPGEMAELTLNLTCPAAVQSFELSVMGTENEDYTVENNRKTLTLGLPDVSVEAEYEQIGSKRSVVAVLQNHGVSPASGSVQFLASDGSLLSEGLYENLLPGELRLLYWELDENKLQYAPCDIDVRAVCTTEDAVAYDNATSIFLPEREILPEISSVTQSGTQISVELTSAVPGATVFCALYDGQDRMIGIQTASADGQTLTFEAGSAKQAKIFLTNGSYSPVCEAKSIRLS